MEQTSLSVKVRQLVEETIGKNNPNTEKLISHILGFWDGQIKLLMDTCGAKMAELGLHHVAMLKEKDTAISFLANENLRLKSEAEFFLQQLIVEIPKKPIEWQLNMLVNFQQNRALANQQGLVLLEGFSNLLGDQAKSDLDTINKMNELFKNTLDTHEEALNKVVDVVACAADAFELKEKENHAAAMKAFEAADKAIEAKDEHLMALSAVVETKTVQIEKNHNDRKKGGDEKNAPTSKIKQDVVKHWEDNKVKYGSKNKAAVEMVKLVGTPFYKQKEGTIREWLKEKK